MTRKETPSCMQNTLLNHLHEEQSQRSGEMHGLRLNFTSVKLLAVHLKKTNGWLGATPNLCLWNWAKSTYSMSGQQNDYKLSVPFWFGTFRSMKPSTCTIDFFFTLSCSIWTEMGKTLWYTLSFTYIIRRVVLLLCSIRSCTDTVKNGATFCFVWHCGNPVVLLNGNMT